MILKQAEMKYLFSILTTVIFLNIGYAQPELTDPSVTPAPLPISGTGTISFNIINLNTPVSNLSMSISMTKIAPVNGVMSISGVGAAYFNWTYLAGINTFFGTQVVPIPANDGGDIVVQVNVTGTSMQNLPQNGFTANISPGNSSVQAYTWTEALLPVKYSGLNVTNEACKGNLLTWSTASEINNSHFEIEASRNGVNFISIGKVKGDNISSGSNYKFFDEFKYQNDQVISYRLKQIDLNGTFSYSDVFSTKYICERKATFTVAPNPAREEIRAEFFGADIKDVTGVIFDGNGSVVKDVILNTGVVNKIYINNLAPGIYTLQTKIGEQQFNERFIKID